tara:strand:- start:1042 stop:1260 length:219 start_codon:yes stop_codon:yes gene_type:complete
MNNFYSTQSNIEIIVYLEGAAGRAFFAGEVSPSARANVSAALVVLQGRAGEEVQGRFVARRGITYAEKILSL